MNTMLEKQQKSEAIKKTENRGQMQVKDVPPSIPRNCVLHKIYQFWKVSFQMYLLLVSVTEVQPQTPAAAQIRSKPKCSVCKNPMKGHKNVLDCSKNVK